MKRYSRAEMLRESGARPEELADLEARRLLVVNRAWRLFGKREEYYTEGQLGVLRWLIQTRRRACLAGPPLSARYDPERVPVTPRV